MGVKKEREVDPSAAPSTHFRLAAEKIWLASRLAPTFSAGGAARVGATQSTHK